jgi:hypothetical protein
MNRIRLTPADLHGLSSPAPWRLINCLVVAVLVAARAASAQAEIIQPVPRNLWTAPEVRTALTDLIARSATVQRQCERIAGAPVYVVVRLTLPKELLRTGARTTFYRTASGLVVARVEVPAGELFVELLAHEFEHVLEQIEGVDLPALAAAQAEGVRRVSPGVYETDRARAAGAAVLSEIYGSPDPVVTAVHRNVARAARVSWRTMKLAAAKAQAVFR